MFGVPPTSRSLGLSDFIVTLAKYVFVGVLSMVVRLLGVGSPPSGLYLALSLLILLAMVGLAVVPSPGGSAAGRRAALTIAAGAPAFFLLAGSARVSREGAESEALASRYYDVVIVMALPVIALGVSRLVSGSSSVAYPMFGALSVSVLVLNIHTFVVGATAWGLEADDSRHSLTAQAELIDDGGPRYPENPPDPLKSPGLVTQDDLRGWASSGQMDGLALTPQDRATAEAMLQVSVRPLTPNPTADCALTRTEVPPAGRRLSVPANQVVAITLVLADGTRSRSPAAASRDGDLLADDERCWIGGS